MTIIKPYSLATECVTRVSTIVRNEVTERKNTTLNMYQYIINASYYTVIRISKP